MTRVSAAGLVAAFLTLVVVPGTADPGTEPFPDPAHELANPPWPGMTAWDVVWCRDLVFRAGLVEIREPGTAPRTVRVADARGWRKPNGFYGLRLNGQPVDEGTVWLLYAGTMTNLRALFTYGSRPWDDPNSPLRWRD